MVLTDAQVDLPATVPRGEPTRDLIFRALELLVHDSLPGDQYFFSFSGHGKQVPDTNGDEVDFLDEALLPSDYQESRQNFVLDDELKKIVTSICKGSQLTALTDSCYSGRLPLFIYIYSFLLFLLHLSLIFLNFLCLMTDIMLLFLRRRRPPGNIFQYL